MRVLFFSRRVRSIGRGLGKGEKTNAFCALKTVLRFFSAGFALPLDKLGTCNASPLLS